MQQSQDPSPLSEKGNTTTASSTTNKTTVEEVTDEEAKQYFKYFYPRNTPNAPRKSVLYFVEWKLVSAVVASGGIFYALVSGELQSSELARTYHEVFLTLILTFWLAVLARLAYYTLLAPVPVYLVDFATLKPEPKYKVTKQDWLDHLKANGYTDDSLEFVSRLLKNSCLSDETHLLHQDRPLGHTMTMADSREEAQYIFYTTFANLMEMTGTRPRDVDILIINCSLFCPTPSLAAMVMNKFQMRDDCLAYNLGGMGCSAGLIAIDLAKDLLRANPDKLCVVLSTEVMCQNLYYGREKAYLLSNSLFRMGGAAVLLSNRRADKARAKYAIEHVVRVNKASEEAAYQCVFLDEDSCGKRGVRLDRKLVEIAGRAIESNLITLGPLVLPLSEQFKFFYHNIFLRKWMKQRTVKRYIPQFSKVTRNFCIHAGGRAVIAGLAQTLNLPAEAVAPSKATLFRWGNTSSSSVWYELEYIENSRELQQGELVIQLAFGSGFKCNSAVWRRL